TFLPSQIWRAQYSETPSCREMSAARSDMRLPVDAISARASAAILARTRSLTDSSGGEPPCSRVRTVDSGRAVPAASSVTFSRSGESPFCWTTSSRRRSVSERGWGEATCALRVFGDDGWCVRNDHTRHGRSATTIVEAGRSIVVRIRPAPPDRPSPQGAGERTAGDAPPRHPRGIQADLLGRASGGVRTALGRHPGSTWAALGQHLGGAINDACVAENDR